MKQHSSGHTLLQVAVEAEQGRGETDERNSEKDEIRLNLQHRQTCASFIIQDEDTRDYILSGIVKLVREVVGDTKDGSTQDHGLSMSIED